MDTSTDKHDARAEHIEMMANERTTTTDALHDEQEHLKLWQAARTFPRIVLFSLAACTAGMTFGYDVVINGAAIAMPSFLITFGAVTPAHALYLPSIWASLFSAMSALGQAFGGITIAPLSDKYGRKVAIIVSCLISAIGVGLQYGATSRGMILGGKIVNGFAIGGILSTATAWASEMSPMCLRGPIQSGIVLLTVLSQVVALVVVRQHIAIIAPSAFRTVFAIQWAFCGLTCLLFFLVPESPTWLILKGRNDQAKKAVARLYGNRNDPEAWYESIASKVRQEAAQEHASGIGGFLDLYRGSNLKRTMTVHLLFFGIGLAGSSFLAQSIYFLLTAGLPAIHTFDVSIGGFALAFFAIIASWVYLEKVGRRSLWLVGCAVNTIVMAVIGGLYWAPGKGALWAIAILMNIMVCWQSTTLTSVAFVITGEISPYRLRSKNQAIAILSNALTTWLFNFVVPYMYNIDSGDLGARTALVFAGSSLVLLLVSYPLIPDLRGLTTAEVDWLYENKIAPRKFQRYTDGRAADGVAAVAAEAKAATV